MEAGAPTRLAVSGNKSWLPTIELHARPSTISGGEWDDALLRPGSSISCKWAKGQARLRRSWRWPGSAASAIVHGHDPTKRAGYEANSQDEQPSEASDVDGGGTSQRPLRHLGDGHLPPPSHAIVDWMPFPVGRVVIFGHWRRGAASSTDEHPPAEKGAADVFLTAVYPTEYSASA